MLVAVVERDLVGVLALQACPYFERPGSWGRITALAVDERHRRAGIGSRLVTAAERGARDLGCVDMEVMTRRARTEALAFYAALGYGDRCGRSARLVRPLAREGKTATS